MHKSMDSFSKQLPKKVIANAQQFSRTFNKFYQQPVSPVKNSDLKQLAEYNKKLVEIAVEQGKFQNNLYATLEMHDVKTRRKYNDKLQSQDQLVSKNRKQSYEKHNKNSQKYNKHLNEVYKKFSEQQKQKKQMKDQKAVELRKKLLEFYSSQVQRKTKQSNRQVSVSTCYQNALMKINKIHQKNLQYSFIAEKQLDDNLKKNDNRHNIVSDMIKCCSLNNQNKKIRYEQYQNNLSKRQSNDIQTYCKDLDASNKAFAHQDQDKQKNAKRIQQYFKRKHQRWSECKKRVDDIKAQVPTKCLNILDRTTKGSFRQTVSSFRSSSVEWSNKVKQNKSEIKYHDELKKDHIMQTHNDLTLRNSCGFRINQKMASMRLQARKTAHQFL